MNFYNRHLGDYARRTRHLSTYQHGVLSQLLDDYYVTEQGIPKNLVYDLVRAKKPSEKKEVNSVLEQYFFLSEDGETWLNARAEEEIAAYHEGDKGRAEAQKQKTSTSIRQERYRAERKALFAEAKSLGLTPAFDASISVVREMIKSAKNEAGSVTVTDNGDVTVTKQERNGDVTVTANQTPEANNQTPNTSNQTHSAVTVTGNSDVTVTPPVTDLARAVTPPETTLVTPVTPNKSPTPSDVCRVLKAMKIATVNPSHPDLAALLNAGVGIDDFVAAVPSAFDKTHPFNYLLGKLKGQLIQAQQAISAAGLPLSTLPAAKGKKVHLNKQVMLEESNKQIGDEWEQRMREELGLGENQS